MRKLILILIGCIWSHTAFAACDADTMLMLHMNGTDGSTTFTDSSPSVKTVTPSGDVELDTAQKKFGTASALFGGVNGYLLSSSTDFDFAGDFTLEAWVNTSTVTSDGGNRRVMSNGDGGEANAIEMTVDTSGRISIISGGAIVITGTTNISGAGWVAFALSRSGSSVKAFVNGTQEGSTWTSSQNFNYGSALYVGTYPVSPGTAGRWVGWIDELRVSDVARYTGNYTPQTAEFCSTNSDNFFQVL